jgi:SAM-dependent methyltransferase
VQVESRVSSSREQSVPGFGLSSYEVVPYASGVFRETHPDTLATIATLFGMKPPDVPRARVLEIGCGLGENIIPMAAELPEARLLGIDQSERQVAEGRATIEAAGLKNVELRRMNVLDAGPEFGTFDYIICHGVFSWVPAEVQQRILALIAATLAPDGVAYVSYNVYPGWHLKNVVRDAMLFHMGGEGDPQTGIRTAREMLDFLVQFASGPEDYYMEMLRDHRTAILRQNDSYLCHEFLGVANQPLYYHQFLERIAPAGLKALADTELSRMECFAPEPLKAALGRMSDDPARREGYLDLLGNRTFRRTLLCHEGVELTTQVSPTKARNEATWASSDVQIGRCRAAARACWRSSRSQCPQVSTVASRATIPTWGTNLK